MTKFNSSLFLFSSWLMGYPTRCHFFHLETFVDNSFYCAMRERSVRYNFIISWMWIIADNLSNQFNIFTCKFGYWTSRSRVIIDILFSFTKTFCPSCNYCIWWSTGSQSCYKFFMNCFWIYFQNSLNYSIISIELIIHFKRIVFLVQMKFYLEKYYN